MTTALKELRRICAAFPGTIETKTYGHPTFQAGPKKTFAVLDDHEREGQLCIAFKASLVDQRSLIDDVDFFPCKYGARHGWTVAVISNRLDWTRVAAVVAASYRLVAPKLLLATLDRANA